MTIFEENFSYSAYFNEDTMTPRRFSIPQKEFFARYLKQFFFFQLILDPCKLFEIESLEQGQGWSCDSLQKCYTFGLAYTECKRNDS